MEKIDSYDYLVVGAGIAGLTVAHELVKNNKKVLVVEKNKVVGGLAKSFHYTFKKNKITFDIGPKRFHTEDKEVLNFLKKILHKNYIITGRKSSIYAFGDYYNWPITPQDIIKLPILIKFEIFIDLFKKIVGLSKDNNSKRFDQYIEGKYGKSLYKYFFKDYTEKFTGVPSKNMSADWASTGINRSIIDKKAKGYSIFDLVKNVILPTPVNTRFIYPKSKGFGYFTDELARIIAKNKGIILTGRNITELNIKRSIVSIDDKKFKFSHLIWTGNLLDLGRLLGERFRGLDYISTIFYNFLIRRNTIRDDMWIYCHYHKYGGPPFHTVRLSISNNFASYVTPKGYKGLVVEKTCRYGDKVWSNPEKYTNDITKELITMGLIANQDEIQRIYIEPVKDTYPLYNMDYKKYFTTSKDLIEKKSNNIILLGRSGSYWYNNADHSIKAALDLSKYLLGQTSRKLQTESIFS